MCFGLLETRSQSVAQAGLELVGILLRANVLHYRAWEGKVGPRAATAVQCLTFVLLETSDRATVTRKTGAVSPGSRSTRPLPEAPARGPASLPARSSLSPTPTSPGSLWHAASRAAVFRLLQTDHADSGFTVERRHDVPQVPTQQPRALPFT